MENWLSKRTQIAAGLLLFSTVALAQTGKISGKLTDASGEAVVGASAIIKNTAKGATNATGVFTIANPAGGTYTVVRSSIGYTGRELKATVPGSENLAIKPEETAASPDGFPGGSEPAEFLKTQLEANPNADYSTLSLPPRSCFLTVTNRF